MLRIIVLGMAAGGGFPQWNSNGAACRRARSGDTEARPATQASLAVSADGERWFLLNASPDLRQQINDTPALHPRHGLRSSPISGVVLTSGDIDAIAGLLNLREGTPFTLHAGARVQRILADNTIFNVLNPEVVRRVVLPTDVPTALLLPDGQPSGLEVEAFVVPGKVALYLEDARAGVGLGTEEGDTLGLEVRATDGGGRFLFVPACAAMTDALRRRIDGAPLVFFDGTLWADDEMVAAGLGPKTGRRMGHLSMSGPDGTMALFEGLSVGRKLFIHVNNSNPALLADSPERAELTRAGWELAADGMEITL